MVYRLHRASKFLRIRLFAVLIIYALIIGVIGITLLNFVVLFDTESFTPQLKDENETNFAILRGDIEENSEDTILLCENYNGEDCNYLLLDDLREELDRRGSPDNIPFIFAIEDAFLKQEIMLVQGKQNNLYSLVTPRLQLTSMFEQTYNNQSFNFQILFPGTVNEGLCFSLAHGDLCEFEKANGINLNIEPNLRLYQTTNFTTQFIGARVLIDSTTNQILCENIFSGNCKYWTNDLIDEQYTFNDPVSRTEKNISAYEAIIKPNFELSGVPSADTEQGFEIIEICKINTGDCDSQIFYKHAESDRSSFVFSNLDGIFFTGFIDLFSITPSSTNSELIFPLNQVSPSNTFFGCTLYHTRSVTNFFINHELPVECTTGSAGDEGNSGNSFSLIQEPLYNSEEAPASEHTKIVFSYDFSQNRAFVSFATFPVATGGKPSFDIIMNILSNPNVFFKEMFQNDIVSTLLPFIIGFFIVNLLISFLLVSIRFWRLMGRVFGVRIPLLLRGKPGKLLELTQFFEFSGQWYLEIHGVTDYNFKSTMGVAHELVNERWRDTIFFPTALAASISILIFTMIPSGESLLFLFVVSGVMPVLLAFWVPSIWVMQDSGLKRVEWSESGELLTIEKVSKNLRDGFNKLVGFGAIFGIGTAGAALARSEISGGSISSLTAFTGGVESLLSLNWNFLISAGLWTVALLCLITAVSMVGNTMTSLSYLNSGHLENVKKTRVKLQEKGIFLGTTQQSMDHSGKDISVYYDSQSGISELYKKATARGIIQQKKLSEDELTKLEVEEPDQDNLFKNKEDDASVESQPTGDSQNTPEKQSNSISGSGEETNSSSGFAEESNDSQGSNENQTDESDQS